MIERLIIEQIILYKYKLLKTQHQYDAIPKESHKFAAGIDLNKRFDSSKRRFLRALASSSFLLTVSLKNCAKESLSDFSNEPNYRSREKSASIRKKVQSLLDAR
jgi:hypothetical protein